jgi:hypothetical protein
MATPMALDPALGIYVQGRDIDATRVANRRAGVIALL